MSNQIARQLACVTNTLANTPVNISTESLQALADLVQPIPQIITSAAICAQLADGSYGFVVPWATSDGSAVTARGFLNPNTLAEVPGATPSDPCNCPCLDCGT
jgi:hypothetical protein